MRQLEELLLKAQRPGSENRLRYENLRGHLTNYLGWKREEEEQFPEDDFENHWNLIAADWDRDQPTQFLAYFFLGEQVTFIAGHGPWEDVRDFGENLPKDCSVPDARQTCMKSFDIAGSCEVSLTEL